MKASPTAFQTASIAPPTSSSPQPLLPTSPTPASRLQTRKYLGYRAGTAYLRRRFGALFIDGLVCLPLMIPCAALMGGTGPDATLLYLSAYVVYFFLFEFFTGQTIGKRAAGLCVAREDGKPLDATGVGARNALRVIDYLPGVPLVGALFMALTGERRKRLGDLAGRTVVVEATEHPFVRGRRSALIVIYPAVWIGLALASGLL